MPAKTLKKRRAAVSAWYERHKAERAAYMRKYRRKVKRAKASASATAGQAQAS